MLVREVGLLASEPGKHIKRDASGKFLSLGVIPADRVGPEYAFEPKPLLREDEGDDSGRRQASENLDSCTDCTLISRAPQPPWRRAPRTPRGQRPCPRDPNRPLRPQSVSPRCDWLGSGRWRP